MPQGAQLAVPAPRPACGPGSAWALTPGVWAEAGRGVPAGQVGRACLAVGNLSGVVGYLKGPGRWWSPRGGKGLHFRRVV